MNIRTIKSRSILSLVAASIAWQPIYGQRFSLPNGAERLPSAPISTPAINLKPDSSGAVGTTPGNLRLPGVKLQGSKSCDASNFSKFKDLIKVGLDKDGKTSAKAPILNDIGPCDLELYGQCTQTLITALNNPAQALVGLDSARDSQIELGSIPKYSELDVRTIRDVVGQLNDLKESVKPGYDPGRPHRILSSEEQQLDTILDVNLPAQRGVFSAADVSAISSIHLNLSSELVAMSEAADAEPTFLSIGNPRALLQEINPVADAAFSCLLGFKKPSAEQAVRSGKRKVIGYASGIVYGEVGHDSQSLTAAAATIIAAVIGAVAVFATQVYSSYKTAELEREKMAHDSKERALDRELEREKAGLPPKTEPDSKTSKTPSEKPAPKPNLKPIISPEVTENKFPPLKPDDVNAIPNSHWVDGSEDCKIVLDKSSLSQTWKPDNGQVQDERLPIDTSKGHLDYQNPLDTTNYKLAKIVSLKEFQRAQQDLEQNRTCEVVDYDRP